MNGFVGRWLKLSIVALVGCGFVGLMVYALLMKDQILNAQVEPPLIAAPEEPAKRRPEQPGGLEIPNQDKMVFDLLEHPSPTDLTSSQPLLVDAPSATEAAPEVQIQTVEVSPSAGANTVAAATKQVEEVALAGPQAIAQVKEVEPAAAPVAQVVEKPTPVAKVEEAKKEEPKTEPAARGGWGVQLAAVGSEADAQKAIAGFSKLAPLKGMTSKVSKVDLGAKGVRYRVQYAGVADKNAAAAVCSKLGKKQACMPVAIK